MGIFRNTYVDNKIITDININKLVDQQRRTNYLLEEKIDFEKEKFQQEQKTKDRVDISLDEYNSMKKTLKKQEELIRNYEDFYNKLSEKLMINPEDLLKYEVVHREVERCIDKWACHLKVIFETVDINENN